ncbi:uncharacterized protein [Chelonus insularis]|uniref:uncharacterized protein n=1 Tax=Chelonus insularis TaxID=460826 RepID=UPI00158DF7B7|nr:uncharacterized protein LOC118070054 [Chelonus insularis]
MWFSGVLNGGMGYTHLNKFLSALNIPEMHWNTFKTYEKEVGKAIEELGRDSCKRAVQEERELTIKNHEKLRKLLPSHFQRGYIFPDVSAEQERRGAISDDNVVRIAASFDMGWPTKGSGKSYDSLSGTGELIGYFTNTVLSIVVLNRKCRMCDQGHSKETHDCRLNYEESAKSMESAAAVRLIKDNPILTKCKVEGAIFISDNDSSAIAAVRNAVNYEVVKVDDTNHTRVSLRHCTKLSPNSKS